MWLCSSESLWRGNEIFLGCAAHSQVWRRKCHIPVPLHCVQGWCRAKQEALHQLSQCKLHSWPALGALFQSATTGQYKGTEHPLIPGARSTPALLAAFSCSVANAGGKLTPGLQLLLFALALHRWAVSMSTVLCQEESSCAHANVLLTRHCRRHVSSELQLLVHDAQPQWIKTSGDIF